MPPTLDALLQVSTAELWSRARQHLPSGLPALDRASVIAAILDATDADERWGAGVCELHTEGFGFLRAAVDHLLPGPHDIYLSPNQVRRMELQTGDTLIGRTRPPQANERFPAMLWIGAINGVPASAPRGPTRPARTLPSVQLPIASDPWLAQVDMLAPLGLGARGIVVGRPDRHRAALLQRLAQRLAQEPPVEVTALLIGGRPEERSSWEAIDAIEVFSVPLDESEARMAGVMDLVTARAARRADAGREHLLIVDDLGTAWRAASQGGEGDAIRSLRRWLARAGDRPDAGSVTLIAAVSPALASLPILSEALDGLTTWRLALRPSNDDLPWFDPHDSRAYAPEALLEANEYARRQAWFARLPSDPIEARDALRARF